MIQYDRAVIQQFADRLYAQARRIVVIFTLVGLLVGLAAGAALATSAATPGILVPVLLVVILGAILGYSTGQARAFALRLQAQIALCQVQIEENTRAYAGARVARSA